MFRTFSLIALAVILSLGCGPSGDRPSTDSGAAESSSSDASTKVDQSNPSSQVDQVIPGIGMASRKEIVANVDPADLEPDQSDAGYDLKLLSWNVESEGADPNVIAEQLTMLNAEDRYAVVGLTEVMPDDLETFQTALGPHYQFAHTKSGSNDRMQILFNTNEYEQVRQFEVDEINIGGRYRAPLVVHLKRRTDGSEFLVMINHLARGKAEIRQQQATKLVEWARDETMPVVAIGDYNFDFVFETQEGNPAFVNFMRDNIWQWVKPEEWIDTNWYDDPKAPDGADDYPGSMLDFAFAANAATEWTKTCRVIVRENDFPDDPTTSDHRPYELLIQVPAADSGSVNADQDGAQENG